MKTAKQLFHQSVEEKEKEELAFLLEDAETDLKRAVEVGKREVAKLERESDQKVMDYVQGGELNVLLQFERDLDAKKDDIKRLEKILSERFPKES